MSDLSDLHGIYPTSLRWNAESGFLAIAVYNAETGERELQQIEFGKPATFAMDLATRERGYGQIKVGLYDMKLTPVGSSVPPWPDNNEYKPAVGVWMWSPATGEVRLETNATIFRETIASIWSKAGYEPQAAEGQQPVVRFTDRVEIPIKSLNKTFYGPVIKVIGWVERDKVPGWRERAPTVPLPVAMSLLTSSPAAPVAEMPSKATKAKVKQVKPGPNDPIDDTIPW